MKKYPIARQGIYRTIQGEGALIGMPMVFIRLAGCSIGCRQCDTDYSVFERLTAQQISRRVEDAKGNCEWVWITGGEPSDHDLLDLAESLRSVCKVAIATSGVRPLGPAGLVADFISVSPHGKPYELNVLPWTENENRTMQINLVPSLNGLELKDWEGYDASKFNHRLVTPLWGIRSIDDCMAFIRHNKGWRLGIQAHKYWGLP